MKACFPVYESEGLDSKVYGHFGSAPAFVIVDTKDNSLMTINNRDKEHEHGMCNPLTTLNNQKIDAVVVGGIGAGALNKFNQAGIRVFQAQAPSVKENITLLKESNLPEFTLQQCCPGHGHNSGCKH